MMIDSGFPPVNDLKTLELCTIGYLRDCKALQEDEGFGIFYSKADIAYGAFSAPARLRKSPIDFQSYFDLIIAKKHWRFHVGCIIQNDYSHLSYYLAICDYNATKNTCEIRRKFHFDYDNGTGYHRQPHPRYHVQYAGNKPSGMGDHGDALYERVLYPPLSEPRFHYTPISLALLLNCVFIEFKTEITNKISEDSKWRDLVKTNETKLLRPYYGNCWNLFNGSHSSKRLFTTDYCYGK